MEKKKIENSQSKTRSERRKERREKRARMATDTEHDYYKKLERYDNLRSSRQENMNIYYEQLQNEKIRQRSFSKSKKDKKHSLSPINQKEDESGYVVDLSESFEVLNKMLETRRSHNRESNDYVKPKQTSGQNDILRRLLEKDLKKVEQINMINKNKMNSFGVTFGQKKDIGDEIGLVANDERRCGCQRADCSICKGQFVFKNEGTTSEPNQIDINRKIDIGSLDSNSKSLKKSNSEDSEKVFGRIVRQDPDMRQSATEKFLNYEKTISELKLQNFVLSEKLVEGSKQNSEYKKLLNNLNLLKAYAVFFEQSNGQIDPGFVINMNNKGN